MLMLQESCTCTKEHRHVIAGSAYHTISLLVYMRILPDNACFSPTSDPCVINHGILVCLWSQSWGFPDPCHAFILGEARKALERRTCWTPEPCTFAIYHTPRLTDYILIAKRGRVYVVYRHVDEKKRTL